MRRVAALVMMAVAGNLVAQQAPATRVAPPGAEVRVITKRGRVDGIVSRASREGVMVEVSWSKFVSVDGADIVEMAAQLPDGSTRRSIKAGMFWGFVAGAVVGAAVAGPNPPCYAVACNPVPNAVGGAVGGGLIGMLGGGIVGSQIMRPALAWFPVRADTLLASGVTPVVGIGPSRTGSGARTYDIGVRITIF